jgi:gas vesicle protein
MEETYYILQIIFVGILVAVTTYYAIQTHRQADLLKRQLDETSHIHNVATRKQAIERIYEWARYGADEYCISGYRHCDRDHYPISAEDTSHLMSLATRALSNALYVRGDLWDKVNEAWDSMSTLIKKSLKSNTELSPLSDSEYERHIKDLQESVGALSAKLSAVMMLCDRLIVELDRETSR